MARTHTCRNRWEAALAAILFALALMLVHWDSQRRSAPTPAESNRSAVRSPTPATQPTDRTAR